MSETIEPGTWASFLDGVTAAQHGYEVTLELLDPDLGDQHEADGLPLASVGYDHGDDVVIVALSSKDDPNEIVIRRMISAPRSIAATPPVAGQVKAIRVENDDGVTLVELEPRPELSA